VTSTGVLIRSELSEALRSRWVVGYGILFAVLALGLSLIGLSTVGSTGLEGYGRTTASLINLCLLLVPLVALVVGTAGMTGDRDTGLLEVMLAQPIKRSELLLGRFAGALVAVGLSTILGFGLAGLLIGLATGAAGGLRYLAFLAIALALAAVYIAIGLAISVIAQQRMRALAAALIVWFASVVFFDLMLIGAGALAGAGVRVLTAAMLLNPVEVGRILALLLLDPSLEVLGPVGGFLVTRFGTAGAASMLVAALASWVAAPLVLALVLFEERDPV
jgi:Cu-processing system permease protein